MGLIKAAIGAVGGTMADQWKEFFYCEALPKEVLVRRGQKQTGRRSSNNRGNDNIITSGSGIAVADGQCMIIVEQGRIVEVCAEPGEYTYDTSTEPSIFAGSLGEGIRNTFHTIGKRFAYGGDTGKDQRVYYFNTKELIDNKFGTPSPIPFRVVDSRIGLDIDVSVRCSGVYSYRIADPLLFYTNVCGNVAYEYTRDELDHQLKSEFISALQPAFAKLSEMEMRPNQIVAHNTELENAMNVALSQEWVTDEYWGNGIKLLVENDTDKKVSVSTNALIVNNYMVTDTFVADVAAGKKTNEVMYLDSDELEAAGVDNIGQIEIYFCAYDSESYDTLWDADVVTLQTSAYAQMDMTADEEKEGLELFNEAGIRVVGMAVDENSYWGKSILFYIENTSDKNVYVSVEDLSINGYMIEPYYSQMVYAGKKAVSAMDLLQNDLDANNIESIDEVELKFQVYDAVTFDDIVVSDPISFATE